MFLKHRGLKISIFGALVMLGSLVFQGVAAAHHPEIEATAECFSATTARITATTSAWVTPEADHRINTNVELSIAGQIFHGAFNQANGYQFSVTVDVPANGATYTARATAIASWGSNGEFGSAGEFRETSVTVPTACVESGPSTTVPATTVPPTTVPATTVPPTTVPPTTVATTSPSTTVGSISTIATTVPTTIPVQVQGVTEVRTDVIARTGTNTLPLIVMGLSLIFVGAFIELNARRRRLCPTTGESR